MEIRERCKNTKINILAHSLGARVVLGALKTGGGADSVQLIAPAVDRTSVETGGSFSNDEVYTRAGAMHVWHNIADDALEFFCFSQGSYPGQKKALGEAGYRRGRADHPGLTQSSWRGLLLSDFSSGRLFAIPDDVQDWYEFDAIEDTHSGYIESPS